MPPPSAISNRVLPKRRRHDSLKKSSSQGNLSQRTDPTVSCSSSSEEQTPTLPQHIQNSPCDDVNPSSQSSRRNGAIAPFFENGIPREVIVFNEHPTHASLQEEVDSYDRLDNLQVVNASYKARISSSRNLLKSLEAELEHTQCIAQGLLNERNTLLKSINDIEEAEDSKFEQNSLLKMLLCFALFLYLCGGSEQFLVFAVCSYLMADTLASAV